MEDIKKILKEVKFGAYQKLKKLGLLNNVLELTSFLDKFYHDPSWSQRFWHIRHARYEIIYCKICNQNPSRYRTSTPTGYYTCSEECAMIKYSTSQKNISRKERDLINKKRIKTCLDKYGVEYPILNDIIKEKTRKSLIRARIKSEPKRIKTCLERYGVENPMQDKEIKLKQKNTMLDNHGGKWNSQTPEFIEKYKGTCLERYGVTNYAKTEECRNKTIKTNLMKFGVENAMENIEIMQKSFKNSHIFKKYKLPSGLIVGVQGYENIALDYLLRIYDENDIIIKTKDIIKYTDIIKYGNRIYYPDLFIISENQIIEVKSNYTFNRDRNNNLLKKQACINLGFKFRFMVYNGKKKLLNGYNE